MRQRDKELLHKLLSSADPMEVAYEAVMKAALDPKWKPKRSGGKVMLSLTASFSYGLAVTHGVGAAVTPVVVEDGEMA